ncbi:hypothetical protein Ptr902_05341 [Pyrenophora tritici-repentis]|nr:hypothetical protein Alg130_00343 [Pyrenophora tritici-repentis]KAI0615421.1 hypothetical protein TUN205_00346 [Pyrenophora tritici-repentis]KAI0627478.1 hypothetical protein TUN199_00545 [Pyrenophora tritici-repentis]KAI2483024.1 hypothetical protein Ptr902_05341 [Pyrenophora tritici-repentis]
MMAATSLTTALASAEYASFSFYETKDETGNTAARSSGAG